MLRLLPAGHKAAAASASARADRSEDISGSGDRVRAVLGEHVVDVGEESGRLAASLRPGAAENLFTISASTIEFGSKVPYAKFYFGRAGVAPVKQSGVEAAARELVEWITHG